MQSRTTIKDKLEEESLKREENDVVKMWTPYKDRIDEKYKFVSNNLFFNICSNILLYGIAIPILFIFNKVVFGFKIKGKENFKKVKGAKITISNHIHILDCTMIGVGLAPKKIYFPTIANNFRIPLVKTLIKLLNAIPIPKGIKAKEKFVDALVELLKEEKTIHFYPEANLIPYDKNIRKFKKGAFKIAVENNAAIIPIVFSYREVKGFRKLFNKKPFITMNILEPVYIKDKENLENEIEDIKNKMQEIINN